MCTGATIMLAASLFATAASTGVAMYSADTQAKQQEANLKFQAAQAEADAKAAQGEAYVEAKRIRDAAKAQRAQATAAAAAAGIDVNSPTALKINETITRNSEEDALLTIMGGGDRAARMGQQAHIDRTGASLVRSEGRTAQVATLLNGVAQGAGTYGQWKRARAA